MDKKIEVNQETMAEVSGGGDLPDEQMVNSDGPLHGKEWFFCRKCGRRLVFMMHSDLLGTLYRCKHCNAHYWYYNGEWILDENHY